jgi:hypothetical protein
MIRILGTLAPLFLKQPKVEGGSVRNKILNSSRIGGEIGIAGGLTFSIPHFIFRHT